MRAFEMPSIEVVAFEVEDIITTSAPACDEDYALPDEEL